MFPIDLCFQNTCTWSGPKFSLAGWATQLLFFRKLQFWYWQQARSFGKKIISGRFFRKIKPDLFLCYIYRYLHMWAWLIMDYTTSEESGHWKCKLTSDMFLCGERKDRNLTLFCIPNFVMKCLTCLFGSKEYPGKFIFCNYCIYFAFLLHFYCNYCIFYWSYCIFRWWWRIFKFFLL